MDKSERFFASVFADCAAEEEELVVYDDEEEAGPPAGPWDDWADAAALAVRVPPFRSP